MRDNARRLLTILTVILALWLVLGFWPLSIGNQVISGFPVSFSATSHAASKFVEMSMLTGDGRVRT